MRSTATARFQRKLTQLLEARKAAGDRSVKGTLASYCGREAQSWVSNMLSEVRATQPNLEDLENIADFFRVSVNELLRPAHPKDLSADEQRVLLAFRSVSEPIRDHFLALLESASLSAIASERIRHLRRKRETITSPIYGGAVPPEIAGQLAGLALQLQELAQRFTATPEAPATVPAATSARRRVVD